MRELKITTFASDLRAEKDACAFLFGEPCGVSIPLPAGRSVAGTMRNAASPGLHAKTAPVLFSANASFIVLPGSVVTVASSDPSLNAATAVAEIPGGMRSPIVSRWAGSLQKSPRGRGLVI